MKMKNLSLQWTTLLAELIGTFLLTIVALATQGNLIVLGFSLTVLVLAIGSVSGAHVNPAVTFGLWSVRKLETLRLPFYWVMQFAGALIALLLFQWFKDANMGIAFNFNHFDARLVVAEVLGAAAFTFAIGSVIQRELSDSAKALAIGFGLLAGLAIGGGLLGQAAQSSTLLANAKDGEAPRVTKVDGAVINPAIALAATEREEQQNSLQSMTGEQDTQTTKKQAASRLTWETLVGALLGGAIGMNLAMVTAGVNPFARKETVITKVVKTVKGKK